MSLPVIQSPSGASSRGSHQLAAIGECARKWVLRYRQRIVPRVQKPWQLGGTLIHDSVAQRYAERMMERGTGTPTWWTGDDVDTVLNKAGEGYPDLIQVAREIYDAYPAFWWDLADEQWDPIAVEEEFTTTVGEIDPDGPDESLNDEVVTCRTDLVIRNPATRDLYAVDHKSKSLKYDKLPAWNDNSGLGNQWQACVNLLILRRAFPNDNVRGFIINRISRATDKQDNYKFDRHLLEMSNRIYTVAPRVARMQVDHERRVDQMLAEGIAPTPSLWECDGKFGPCDYTPLCHAANVDEMNATLAAHFVNRE